MYWKGAILLTSFAVVWHGVGDWVRGLRRGVLHWGYGVGEGRVRGSGRLLVRGGLTSGGRGRSVWGWRWRSWKSHLTRSVLRRGVVVMDAAGSGGRMMVLRSDGNRRDPFGSGTIAGGIRVQLTSDEYPLSRFNSRYYLQIPGLGIVQVLTVAMDTEGRRRMWHRRLNWRELFAPGSCRQRRFRFVVYRSEMLSARFSGNEVVYLFR